MKSACSVVAWLLATLFACSSVFGSWVSVPLKRRVAGADLIVVGKLTDVEERRFSLTYNGKDEILGTYSSHYDVGSIISPKVLKGDRMGYKYVVHVTFGSKGQDKHPYSHMIISHSSGEEGIWFLAKDRLTGYHFVSGPDNPLPLDSEAEVLKALREISKPGWPAR